MIKTHKDLEIWEESIELVINIYKTLEKFPDSEKFVLASQMQRAVISIPSNIAEGAARQSRKEFIKYLYIALGSLSELETQLIISERLGYLKEKSLFASIEKIRRKILNFIKYLKNKDEEK